MFNPGYASSIFKSRNVLLNLNVNITGNFSVKYNCDISKSKLVFPLPNERYSSLIALVV